MDLDSLCDEILAVYAGMDEKTGAFAARAGLSCPSGCGKCCENPHIEATELEMLPAARFLYDSGIVPEPADLCALYRSASPGRGSCSAYAFRPVVCRLFGYASRRTKTGDSDFAACRVHKAEAPNAVARARILADESPRYENESRALYALEPGTIELLPVNTALERALARVHLARLKPPGPAGTSGDDDRPVQH